MADNTLAEYFVKLGWNVDGAGVDHVQKVLRGVTVQAQLAADVIEKVVGKLKAFSEGIATAYEDLYYASQRNRASVENIKAFQYAAANMGSSAEAARDSIESFGKSLRSNQGFYTVVAGLGVRVKNTNGTFRDTVQIMTDLGKVIARMPEQIRLQYAGMFGFDEQTMRAITSPDFAAAMEKYRKLIEAGHFDPQAAAEAWKDFNNTFRDFMTTLDLLVDKVMTRLVKEFGPAFRSFVDYLIANSDSITTAILKVIDTVIEFAKTVVNYIGDSSGFQKTWQGVKEDISKVAEVIYAVIKGIQSFISYFNELDNRLNKFYEQYVPDFMKRMEPGYTPPGAGGSGSGSGSGSGGEGAPAPGGGGPAGNASPAPAQPPAPSALPSTTPAAGGAPRSPFDETPEISKEDIPTPRPHVMPGAPVGSPRMGQMPLSPMVEQAPRPLYPAPGKAGANDPDNAEGKAAPAGAGARWASGFLRNQEATPGGYGQPVAAGVDIDGLKSEFRQSIEKFQKDAAAAGIPSRVISAYRSYELQRQLYANHLAGLAGQPYPYPNQGGKNGMVGRPGNSFHQFGEAADIVAASGRQQALIDFARAHPEYGISPLPGDAPHFQQNRYPRGQMPGAFGGGRDTTAQISAAGAPATRSVGAPTMARQFINALPDQLSPIDGTNPATLARAPLTTPAPAASSNNVTLNQKTTISVDGAYDAPELTKATSLAQLRVNGDLLRTMQGNAQ